MIPLARPWIDDSDRDAVVRVLKSGSLVQGEEVAAFERAIAELVGVNHAVAVSSGTAALHLALKVWGVGAGDTVLVPAYSFPATANVVLLCGAQLRFVDIDPATFCMDSDALAESLVATLDERQTAKSRTIVLPVHAFGQCAQMDVICGLAESAEAFVVEDAACALGAKHFDTPAGGWGAMGCFSFHPRKTLTTGEGGMIVTDDSDLARTLRLLRNHGMVRGKHDVRFLLPGYNYRMTDVEAALGLSQLGRYGAMLEERRALAAYYDELLSDSPIIGPRTAEGGMHAFQSYVVVLPDYLVPLRQLLLEQARADGVELGIGTYHMPGLETFREVASPPCEVSASVSAASVSLPLYHGLSNAEQDEVVDCVFRFLEAGDT